MNTVYKLPNKDEINDQASLWIARIDRGLSEAESAALRDWVNQSHSHANSLYRMAHLWDKMDDLSRLGDLFEPPKSQQRKIVRAPYAIAASFILALIGLGLGYSNLAIFSDDSTAPMHANSMYETAVGEQSVVTLSDSSILTLNTNTQVDVKYTASARILTLIRGELHIKVAHNKARPLSVIAQDKVVQAVGTAFNVQIMDTNEIELIVTDGKVVVAEDITDTTIAERSLPSLKKNRAVSKGQKLIIGSPLSNVAELNETEITANLSWQQGNIIFTGETLETALREISRYTSTEFEITDPTLKNIRIAGLFKAGDIDGLTLALKQNFNIDSQRVGAQRVILNKTH